MEGWKGNNLVSGAFGMTWQINVIVVEQFFLTVVGLKESDEG